LLKLMFACGQRLAFGGPILSDHEVRVFPGVDKQPIVAVARAA